MMIKGIIGKKVGMTQVFDERGAAVPVTVIRAGPCWITQIKTEQSDGYIAVQMGYEVVASEEPDESKRQRKVERRISKPERGHLGLLQQDENGPRRRRLANPIPPLRYLREFRVKDVDGLEEGQQVTVDIFSEGDLVDVVGTTKGRGFAGTIKRHGFRRQRKTHGQSDRERAPGSIGPGTGFAHVRKGMPMAGRMGGNRVTVQNLEVVVVDPENNLLAVKGSIPGARGGLVMVREAIKRRR
jgi:large subunit ribosomal protein L3